MALGPVPAEIPIRVAGVARDETGSPIAGATITLYTSPTRDQSRGHGHHRREGHYTIRDAMLPVSNSFGGHPFRKEITPYAAFIVSGWLRAWGSPGARSSRCTP